MFAPVSVETELAMRILDVFENNPEGELQLLDIAGRGHISGSLKMLRQTADRLVEQGDLTLVRHGGGRYYRKPALVTH